MNYIYCITNVINNKRYVGKTTQSIQDRFQRHCYDSKRDLKSTIPLYSAMNKYGVENFIVEELEQVENECDLNSRECYWIQELETYGTHGYNATKGGDGAILYDYQEIVDLYNLGFSTTQISEKIGCSVRTISNVLKSKGINSRGRSKIVLQYNLEGTLINTFNGTREAAQWIIDQNLSDSSNIKYLRSRIARACKRLNKEFYNYNWKYKDYE